MLQCARCSISLLRLLLRLLLHLLLHRAGLGQCAVMERAVIPFERGKTSRTRFLKTSAMLYELQLQKCSLLSCHLMDPCQRTLFAFSSDQVCAPFTYREHANSVCIRAMSRMSDTPRLLSMQPLASQLCSGL